MIEITRKLTAASVGSPALVNPSTDNAIVRFDGVAGLQQNSGVTIDDTGNMALVAGAVGTPSLYLGADTTTGLYRSALNEIAIAVSGVNKATLSATNLTLAVDLLAANSATAIKSGAYTLGFSSSVADGASAVGFVFNNTNTLDTDGNRLVSFQNNSTELFWVYGGSVAATSGFSIGNNTVSNGGSAIGSGNDASGQYSICSGFGNTTTSNGCVALGYGSSATGLYAISFGFNANVTGSFSIGGGSITVNGGNSVGWGTGAVNGATSVGIGSQVYTVGNNGLALGRNLVSAGARTTCIGAGSASSSRCSIADSVAFFTNDNYPRYFLSAARASIGSAKTHFADGVTLGSEILANPDFTGSGASWTAGLGWSYSANTMLYNSASGTGTLTQAVTGLVIGQAYRLTANFTALTGSDASGATERMGHSLTGGMTLTFNNRITTGTVSEDFVATATTATVTFTPAVTTALTGTITSCSLKQIQSGDIIVAGTTYLNAITIHDAKDITVNATTGTKIATATTQKLGFWNATPIVQPANTVAIDTLLVNTGLRATGAYANFDTTIQPRAGTATANTSPVKFTTGTKLTAVENGALEHYDSRLWFTDLGERMAIMQSEGQITASATVANTLTETTLHTHTVIAGEFVVGRMFEGKAIGQYSKGGGSHILTIRIKANGTTLATFTTPSGAATNQAYETLFNATCRTVGVSGTIMIHVRQVLDGQTTYYSPATASTLDTTANITLTMTAQWDTADVGSTVSVDQAYIDWRN